MNAKDKLLQAAAQIFEKRGFAGATTAAIAGAAGVAEVTLFRHFSSKAELFARAMERIRWAEGLSDIAGSMTGDVASDLAEISRRLFRYFMAENTTIRMMLFESITNPELRSLLAAGPAEGISDLTRYFARALSTGKIRPADPQFLAEGLVSLVFGYTITFAVRRPSADSPTSDLEDAQKRLQDIVAAAYLPGITIDQPGEGSEGEHK